MKAGYIFLISLVVLIIILFSWGVRINNNMATKDEAVTSQWHQVETQYQRRMDLIPNLAATVQSYANFEKSTLTEVTSLRASMGQASTNYNAPGAKIDDKVNAINQMESSLGRLMVVVEKYPDLKAGEQYSQLMTELEGTENRVSVQRMRFNEVVQDYNTYIRTFPHSMFAGMFHYESRAYFESDAAASKAPNVKDMLKQ